MAAMATSRGWMVESLLTPRDFGISQLSPLIWISLNLDFGNSSKSDSLGVWRGFFFHEKNRDRLGDGRAQ